MSQLAQAHRAAPPALPSIRPVTALAIGATVVLWASAFVGIRVALPAYGPLHLAVLRFGVASLVMLLIAWAAKMRVPAVADLPRILVCGLLGITGYNLALNTGELEVTAGVASLIVNTGPIWTALLAHRLLGDRLRPWAWAGILVSFSGVAVIAVVGTGALGISRGALLILLAALQLSLYSVVQKPLLARYRPVEVTAYAIWAGALGLLPFAPGLLETVTSAPLPATLAVVYLGVGPAALAYLAWSVVLSHMGAARASSFLYMVPPTALAVAWLWLGEAPGANAAIGGALALVGVAIVNRARAARP